MSSFGRSEEPGSVLLAEGLQMLSNVSPDEFAGADPWPYLVIDGLFDDVIVEQAFEQEIAVAHRLPRYRSWRIDKAESNIIDSPAARAILDSIMSVDFETRLRALTGIDDLTADEDLALAGIYAHFPGSFQATHCDFRQHPVTKLYHRVKVLVYLTPQLDDDHGILELWDRDLSRCAARVRPAANRTVIMAVGPDHFHCVPPVQMAEGRVRLTLSCCFYSTQMMTGDRPRPVFWKPRRPVDPLYMSLLDPRDMSNFARRVWGVLRRGLRRPA